MSTMRYGNQLIDMEGTLYEATVIALHTHWKGMRWADEVPKYAWPMVAWFQKEGCSSIDSITSAKLDKYVDHCSKKLKNKPATISNKVGTLRAIWRVANQRKPRPLAKKFMPAVRMPSRKGSLGHSWWLQEETMPLLINHLISIGQKPLALYILWAVNTGLRVEENLRLHFTDNNGVVLRVPGTKTRGSEATLPMSDGAKEIMKVIRKDRMSDGKKVFPWDYPGIKYLWDRHVVPYLKAGLSPGQRPNLRDLRVTFASVLHRRGMPTALLQQLLRHSSIATTTRYIRLSGEQNADMALAYMNHESEAERKIVLANLARDAGWPQADMVRTINQKERTK